MKVTKKVYTELLQCATCWLYVIRCVQYTGLLEFLTVSVCEMGVVDRHGLLDERSDSSIWRSLASRAAILDVVLSG